MFGLPDAGLLLILGVDHLLDMGRSGTNAIGNGIATAVVARYARRCGPLPDPEDDGGERDDGLVVPGGLFVACGDAAELFELVEAALDQVALLVECPVERQLGSPRWIARDDGHRPGAGDGGPEMIGIIGGVCDDGGRPIMGQQGFGLRCITRLAPGQPDPHGAAKAAHGQVDLRAEAAAGAPECLILSPFFAPAAC